MQMVLRTAGLSTGQSVVRVLYVIGVGWTEAIHGLHEDGPGVQIMSTPPADGALPI